jgi:hypothetical protein
VLLVAGAAADGAAFNVPPAAGATAAADALDDGLAARNELNTAGVELVVERLPINIVFLLVKTDLSRIVYRRVRAGL